METIVFFIAIITCFALVLTLIETIFGFKQIIKLSQVKALPINKLPKVSIIFSALNEEKDIEKALTSMLEQNYPNFEIIAINDRSDDKTPEILNKLRQLHQNKLQVIHINYIPKGVLGKNNALHVGASRATGDWFLFTDADVIMKPNLLLQSLSYAALKKIDHLTIFERHLSAKFSMKIAHLGQYLAYTLIFKPWRIKFSASKKYLGHGSFNLTSRKSYETSNGYKAIPMECLDDLKFGELIKKHGFKQDIVDGYGFIEREWYKSLPEMIKGLEKNSFAIYNYKLFPAILSIIFALTFFIWPILCAILFQGTIAYINICNILLTLNFAIVVANQFRTHKILSIFYPISISILVYTVINSIYKTYKNKGVLWRGTHYSIDSLKNLTPPD